MLLGFIGQGSSKSLACLLCVHVEGNLTIVRATTQIVLFTPDKLFVCVLRESVLRLHCRLDLEVPAGLGCMWRLALCLFQVQSASV